MQQGNATLGTITSLLQYTGPACRIGLYMSNNLGPAHLHNKCDTTNSIEHSSFFTPSKSEPHQDELNRIYIIIAKTRGV